MSFIHLIFSNNLYASDRSSEEAIFAMGCFWCGESEFRDHETNKLLPGIIKLRVGYAGGTKPNPTYESHEGYKEAVKIIYDADLISYEKLLTIFWHNIDPFDAKGQFCDKGLQYTAAIFYTNNTQKIQADTSKAQVEKQLNKAVATEVIAKTTFYDAEEYHQNYKAKNPVRYKYYRYNCGRDKRLETIWRNVD